MFVLLSSFASIAFSHILFQVKDALVNRLYELEILKNNFKEKIHNILDKLRAIQVTDADIDVQGVKQNYLWFELTKSKNMTKKFDKLPF